MKTIGAILLTLSTLSLAVPVDTLTQKGPGGSVSFLAIPKTPGKHPALVLAPEWWGVTEYATGRAKQLAEEGYVVLAVDLYGGRKQTHDFKTASDLAGAFYADRSKFRNSIRWALDTLSHRSDVDTAHIGALGFCFGGTAVLEGARAGLPLKIVASFHGGLKAGEPTPVGAFKGTILVLHGGADPFVPLTDLVAIVQELEAAKADYSVQIFPHAVHAFTNPANGTDPSKGMAYNADAERESFAAFHRLLAAKGFARP